MLDLASFTSIAKLYDFDYTFPLKSAILIVVGVDDESRLKGYPPYALSTAAVLSIIAHVS